jgi:hypothetical protein
VDNEVKASGQFGAWILGEGKCDVDVNGAKTLRLCVKNFPKYTEQRYPYRSKQGLFWGEAYFLLKDGTKKKLAELDAAYDNIDPGQGIGRDYEGGRVTIVGNEYPDAVPTSPLDHDAEGVITLDLSGLNAARFVGLIGADAFPGDEAQRRMTYAVRTRGLVGRYVTVVEPYERDSMIAGVKASDADTLEVTLVDGRVQFLALRGIEEDDIALHLAEYKDGRLVREETASGR